MIPFFQSLSMSWSCRQCQMACYLGRAAECDDTALRLVSGERAHTSVFDGRQGRSGRTQRDRTWRELTGSSDSSVRDFVQLEISRDEFCSCSRLIHIYIRIFFFEFHIV